MDAAFLKVEKLDAPVGAEIHGLDLRKNLAPDLVDKVMQAWYEHQVLVFREQDLTPRELVSFTEQLGEPGRPRMPSRAVHDLVDDLPVEVMIVSNIRIDGKPMGLPHDGEMWFHSDMCYTEFPHNGTMLHAVELPSTGGNTLFADMYAAYANLTPHVRERLSEKRALQVHDYKRTERPGADLDLSKVGNYAHPVFITHPETGRKAIYVNRLMTAHIEGLETEEGNALLDELFSVSEDPSIVYEHVWKVGDLVLWDNRCITHARTDFPETERRLLRRTTIVGTQSPS
ncbi:MAG: TauD/TfdA family dioxygenase [Pseudomonadota bacterium]|nr:TauD/TfdA family dioxygenase [Pseudomonadota bacterium]